MLAAEGVRRVVVVCHSLGSAYATYLIRYKPHMLKALTLIDPVAAMLHQPKVTRNFVYKPVTSPLVALEEYYIRREIFTANLLARHLVNEVYFSMDDSAAHWLSNPPRALARRAAAKAEGTWELRATCP